MNLSNHFLIAMPDMADSRFKEAVILICDHNDKGALGIVINHSSKVTFSEILDSMDIGSKTDQLFPALCEGGPVSTECGFIIHQNNKMERNDSPLASSLNITEKLTLTTSKDIIQIIADNKLDANWLFALGCSTWHEGQLEQEISNNTWLTCPADEHIIFHTKLQAKWKESLKLIGISAHQLSGDFGHA